MCGVIGFISEAHRQDLGLVAAELLKTLEYRGYDSTGAAVQGETEEIVLRKGVGAPSLMVDELGIVGLAGSILCGQVRWATFGSVDELNAQPHEVRCKIHIYGAHNGNVTNCDDLKAWLTSEGHDVVSDNDGEMLVHTVEHEFARALRDDGSDRRAAMRQAIVSAGKRLKGSYAAVVVDPVSRTLWAIKQGSSLYFGLGDDFAIASSDLSSVLKLTRTLMPVFEGEFVEYTAESHALYRVRDGERIERAPTRSRLQAKDVALAPQFRTYMEQEIDAQEETCRRVAALFDAGTSSDPDEQEEIREFGPAADAVLAAFRHALQNGGRVFFVCCGSSYHAALAGAVFWSELAHAEIVPVLPGDFRGRFAASLRPADVVVAVSQSGETKDLIDVMNHVINTGLPIRRIGIVNNVSSTLGQEKCEIVLPLRCGPEIAVPATKSYINQLAMILGLAARYGGVAGALASLPALIRETLTSTADAVDEAARLLYLKPSMHILATRLLAVAKEGALKIREVVLNHTEGFEASEFKHGPNTILGVNTVFGIEAVLRYAESRQLGSLYEDYPLIFVTGPDATDVDLTISQINTHKIRGATCVMIAEENAALRQAIAKPPADNPSYRSAYIALPATGSNLMTAFTATVVLQRLALRMSEMKAQYLDGLGLKDHGVHPDVPKNVSKSITVD
jgi:glucosamine 6-phosphate synthetase-like amidotransferase/phosphosugar isomerase protein